MNLTTQEEQVACFLNVAAHPPRTLERLDPSALHERQPAARLGLGETELYG
jgi:hypothetical protein